MGHREDLLEGAKRCLLEKGFARTTAREIVAASGTNLGSIGYHYGSTDALLNAALLKLMEEWGDALAKTIGASIGGSKDSAARLEALWDGMIGSFSSDRTLWIASVEAFLQSLRSPELREQLAAGQHEGRKGLASLLLGIEESALTEEQVRGLGSIQSALFTGLMTQWLTDPKRAPSSREVMEGLRTLGALAGGTGARGTGGRSSAAKKPGAVRKRGR